MSEVLERGRAEEVPLLDRTLDVDGHEFAPPHLWGATFGPVTARLTPICTPFAAMMGEGYMVQPEVTGITGITGFITVSLRCQFPQCTD